MSEPQVEVSELIARHADHVRRLARRFLALRSDVDDVAQEVWLLAAKNPPPRGATRAWLSVVVRGIVADRVRAERRRRSHYDEYARLRRGAPFDLSRARALLAEAIETLPPELRQAVISRYFDREQPLELAQRLGIPSSTARARLRRGLAYLRTALERRGGEERLDWRAALLPLAWLPSERRGQRTIGGRRARSAPSVRAALVAVALVLAATLTLISLGPRSEAPRDVAVAPTEPSPPPDRDDPALPARIPIDAFSPSRTRATTTASDAVCIRVVDGRSKRPLADATVVGTGEDSPPHANDAGILCFTCDDPARRRLALEAGGYASRVVMLGALSRDPAAPTTVALFPGASIRGRLVDQSGAALVRVQPVDGDIVESLPTAWESSADAAGGYAIHGLPTRVPLRVSVWSSAVAATAIPQGVLLNESGLPGERIAQATVVLAEGEQLALDYPDARFADALEPPTLSLELELVGPDGAPPPPTPVRAQVLPRSTSVPSKIRVARSDASGHCALATLTQGVWRLQITPPKTSWLASRVVDVDWQATTMTEKLAFGGRAAGNVLGDTDALEVAFLLAFPRGSSTYLTISLGPRTATGSTRNFVTPTLAPGDYDFVARTADGHLGVAQATIVALHTASGIDIQVGPAAQLIVTVPDRAPPDAYVEVTDAAQRTVARWPAFERVSRSVPVGRLAVRLMQAGRPIAPAAEVIAAPDDTLEIYLPKPAPTRPG